MAPTPMMRQYQELKSANEDSILFFRLGDFYEMFFEDAYKASRILGLTLTSRGKDDKGEKIPMCGIPHHAMNNYIPKLIKNNIKVAICEQTEDANVSKGITKREVVKIITPGTITEDHLLEDEQNNYLMAVSHDSKLDLYGIAYCDISTGEFKVTELSSKNDFIDEFEKIDAKEILIPTNIDESLFRKIYSSYYESISTNKARSFLEEHYGKHALSALGLDCFSTVYQALWAVIKYLDKNKKSNFYLNPPKPYISGQFMHINTSTLNHLEIIKSSTPGNKTGTLLWTIDHTNTAMGTRLLKNWCTRPLADPIAIRKRLDLVDFFYKNFRNLEEIDRILEKVYDLERLNAKIKNNEANPKDLIALSNSLAQIPHIFKQIQEIPPEQANEVLFNENWLNTLAKIEERIRISIVDDPPSNIHSGGFIKSDIDDELDNLRKNIKENKTWFIEKEAALKKATGIKSLKIAYNRVFGYYIDVTKSNINLVPDYFIRKQTLANSERYYTEDLKEKEKFVLNADELILRREIALFDEITSFIKPFHDIIHQVSCKIAIIDCLTNLAKIAKANGYVKPTINNSKIFKVKDARHPVIEKSPTINRFIPNDIMLDNESNSFLIITGPNMAGKSTFMRQTALIAILAQIGSFVPATAADLCIYDKIFTRIGAGDNLFEGKSTFMVEMLESANILNNATESSLIIMDEIGRGTSTFDGLSLAAAIAKHTFKNIKANTLFATHYHEITSLADKFQGMKNMSIAVLEENDKIRFTYKMIPGKAEKSYGIHVAEMAGLPAEIIKDAYSFLEQLEQEDIVLDKTKKQPRQLSLF